MRVAETFKSTTDAEVPAEANAESNQHVSTTAASLHTDYLHLPDHCRTPSPEAVQQRTYHSHIRKNHVLVRQCLRFHNMCQHSLLRATLEHRSL